MICANLFVPNAPFLYPLKISENRFQGVETGCIGNECVKRFILPKLIIKFAHSFHVATLTNFVPSAPFRGRLKISLLILSVLQQID